MRRRHRGARRRRRWRTRRTGSRAGPGDSSAATGQPPPSRRGRPPPAPTARSARRHPSPATGPASTTRAHPRRGTRPRRSAGSAPRHRTRASAAAGHATHAALGSVLPANRFGVPWTQPSRCCIGALPDGLERIFAKFRGRPRVPPHVRSLLRIRQGRARHGWQPRHRPHDRPRVRGGRRQGLHLLPQGGGLRRGRGRAVEGRRVHQRAGRPRDRGCVPRPRRADRGARICVAHPREQRGRELGCAPRRLPGGCVGQGARSQPEVAVLPDPRVPRPARRGGNGRRSRAGHQHRVDRRHPGAR